MPKIISGKNYEDYHPGNVELSSQDKNWNGLIFTRYSHPQHSNGCPRPATNDHLLAFSNNGAVKGDYAFNSSKWKPYTWRQGEWLIGQSCENSRDSRWNSLCAEDVELSVCYIHLAPDILKTVALEAADQDPGIIELPHRMSVEDPFMLQLGLQIKAETENNNPYGKIFIESAANLLAAYLLNHYCVQNFRIQEYKSSSSSLAIRRAIEYIHSSLDQELSLASMAQLSNISIYHFAHLFKQVVGLAPHHYIMNARMEKAKTLLINTNLPIIQIALEVGYTHNHFIQIFKRYTSLTPSQYRRSHK